MLIVPRLTLEKLNIVVTPEDVSEMKEHRNPSLDSREYRNFVT